MQYISGAEIRISQIYLTKWGDLNVLDNYV
jgi:hypothetical protein